MKFDIVIGNPPYQEMDANDSSSSPVYHYFVNIAKKISDIIVFITPSRWMQGGKNLDNFRYNMIYDGGIEYIFDYSKASTIFPNVDIDGGVSYFLYNKSYKGKTHYNFFDKNGLHYYNFRYLVKENIEFVVRDARQWSIIEKVLNKGDLSFSSIVSTRKPYGIATDLFNISENVEKYNLYEKGFNKLKIYGVKGNKGSAQRTFGYITASAITNGFDSVHKYKIFFSYAYNLSSVNYPNVILGEPEEICTETFLNIGPFNNKEEQQNCYEYMQTKFFKALLYFHRFQKNCTHKTFELIPLLDFNKQWTDEELFNRYELTKTDVQYINNLFSKDLD